MLFFVYFVDLRLTRVVYQSYFLLLQQKQLSGASNRQNNSTTKNNKAIHSTVHHTNILVAQG